MIKASLVWITPDCEKAIVYAARVSSPKSQAAGENNEKLIRYLIRNHHWSPFELGNACLSIEAPRDIARQLLRHRSCSFQEFSQRYANVSQIKRDTIIRETRMQDPKNRQASLPCFDYELVRAWERRQKALADRAIDDYEWAIRNGIAKECARVVLPEGLTPSRLYVNGTIRSWLHYMAVRRDQATTQREHVQLADAIAAALRPHIPEIMRAAEKWLSTQSDPEAELTAIRASLSQAGSMSKTAWNAFSRPISALGRYAAGLARSSRAYLAKTFRHR